MKPVVQDLFDDVVSSGLCARCGTCVAVCCEDCLDVGADLTPVYVGGCTSCSACVTSCPGRELPMGDLEREAFGRRRVEEDELGVYGEALAAQATDPETRDTGTSGGVVTALLLSLLESDAINGAVVTIFDPERPYLPVAAIARDAEAIKNAAQSKYALTPQVAALRDAQPGDRLAFVGLPCQIAGLRKAAAAGYSPAEISLSVGLFCLSNFYFEATTFIIEEVLGLRLQDVVRLAYREGSFPGAFSVTTRSGTTHEVPYPDARSYLRMYRPYRCITCSDWSSELADLSIGDMYGDPDHKGFSAVLVRSKRGEEALGVLRQHAAVLVEPSDPLIIATNPGFLYKKRGNRAVIVDAREHGLPTPTYGG